MSSFVRCPDCNRKLKISETTVGKSIRCPACKTLLPPVSGPQSPAEEEPEDDLEPAEERPVRKKSPRKGRSIRKKSSAGLIIGLSVGGVLLLVLGIGGGLFWYFHRNKTIPEAEWQTFTPPGGNCTALMPGKPDLQMMNEMTQYGVERKKGKEIVEAFMIAFYDSSRPILASNSVESQGNSVRDVLLARMNDSKVVSEKAISLGNIPGREYQIHSPKQGFAIARVYLARFGNTHRTFRVMVGGPNIQPDTGDAARFLDSFKIDASALPPALADAADGGARPPFGR